MIPQHFLCIWLYICCCLASKFSSGVLFIYFLLLLCHHSLQSTCESTTSNPKKSLIMLLNLSFVIIVIFLLLVSIPCSDVPLFIFLFLIYTVLLLNNQVKQLLVLENIKDLGKLLYRITKLQIKKDTR